MNSTKKNIAIIIGNGKSREEINLDSLVGQGTIFGCNALYRDFDGYDYLVAIDDRMINEIQTTEKRLAGKAIFPPEDERWESAEYSKIRRRNNAGMAAMNAAIRMGHTMLYCLGFDFILEGEDSVKNVYKGSRNYEPHTQSNTEDNYYRVKYLEWFATKHSDVKFVFVIPDNAKTKKIDSRNIIGVPVSVFTKKVENV